MVILHCRWRTLRRKNGGKTGPHLVEGTVTSTGTSEQALAAADDILCG